MPFMAWHTVCKSDADKLKVKLYIKLKHIQLWEKLLELIWEPQTLA